LSVHHISPPVIARLVDRALDPVRHDNRVAVPATPRTSPVECRVSAAGADRFRLSTPVRPDQATRSRDAPSVWNARRPTACLTTRIARLA